MRIESCDDFVDTRQVPRDRLREVPQVHRIAKRLHSQDLLLFPVQDSLAVNLGLFVIEAVVGVVGDSNFTAAGLVQQASIRVQDQLLKILVPLRHGAKWALPHELFGGLLHLLEELLLLLRRRLSVILQARLHV